MSIGDGSCGSYLLIIIIRWLIGWFGDSFIAGIGGGLGGYAVAHDGVNRRNNIVIGDSTVRGFALKFNSRKIPRECSVEKWIRRCPARLLSLLRSDVL